MDTATSQPPHYLRVTRRTYRKVSKRDARRRLHYDCPEIKLSNRWLAAAGFHPGDRVVVSALEPGLLFVKLIPARA